MNNVHYQPEGYHTITPYLTLFDVGAFIVFMHRNFHAKEISVMRGHDGKVRHAEIQVGDSVMMLAESSEQWRPAPGVFYIYVEDVDALYLRCIAAGCVSVMEPADQFYGDRNAGIKDLWGNTWWIAARVEHVSHDEMKRREQEFMSHK